MARTNYQQTNFTAGQLSSAMYGRTDIDKYANGLKEARNAIVLPQGPITRRPGFRYVSAVKNSANTTRLIPFKFNDQQSYVLEFGNQYIRFFTQEGQLMNGGVPYEISSPYLQSEVKQLSITQSADVLYIFHPNHAPQTLNRLGPTNWTLTPLTYIDGPFLPVNGDSTYTLTSSANGANGTAVTITASKNTFVATDVGRLIRHSTGGVWRSILITAYTSATSVSGTFQGDNPTGYVAGASSLWRLGEWSDTTGWPEHGTIYQQRLISTKGEAIYGSITGDYTTHSPTNTSGSVLDSSGFVYRIGSEDVNNIKWIKASKIVLLGASGGEWIMHAGSLTTPDALTPTNIQITRETTWGSSANVPAQLPGTNVVLFVDKTAKYVRELSYQFATDSYVAPELTLLSRDLTNQGIVDTCYADDVLWMVMTDGSLVTMTYLKDQSVVSFCYHIMGGSLNGASYPAVQSICAISSSDLTYTEVWAIVKRTINGQTVQYVEYLDRPFIPSSNTDQAKAFFVDSGSTYNGAPTNTVSGLTWLEGQTVSILADGAVRPSATVTGGSISLGSTTQSMASQIQVGLKQDFRIQTLDPDVGGNQGSSQGKLKRIEKVILRLLNTLGCKIGRDTNNLDEVNFRNDGDQMNAPPPLFTGFIPIRFEGDYTRETSVVIYSDQPTPITVAGILPSINVNEE